MISMKSKYFPLPSENRMGNKNDDGTVDWDIRAARESFLSTKNKILYQLVKQRYLWMNEFIPEVAQNIIELGCGAGLSKQFIINKNLLLTDVLDNEWVDRYVDALNIDYPDCSLDVLICSHMIHHLASPAQFFDKVLLKLTRGG